LTVCEAAMSPELRSRTTASNHHPIPRDAEMKNFSRRNRRRTSDRCRSSSQTWPAGSVGHGSRRSNRSHSVLWRSQLARSSKCPLSALFRPSSYDPRFLKSPPDADVPAAFTGSSILAGRLHLKLPPNNLQNSNTNDTSPPPSKFFYVSNSSFHYSTFNQSSTYLPIFKRSASTVIPSSQYPRTRFPGPVRHTDELIPDVIATRV